MGSEVLSPPLYNDSVLTTTGPHIGLEYAWPMSLLLQSMTSDNDTEITECLALVLGASRLGLVHESINVNRILDYTRKPPQTPLRVTLLME